MVCTRTLVHSQPIIKCTIINIKWCVKLCFFMWTTSIFNQSAVFPSHAQFQYNFQLLLPASVYSPQENIYFPQPFLVGRRILNIFIFKSLKENYIKLSLQSALLHWWKNRSKIIFWKSWSMVWNCNTISIVVAE